MKHPIYWFCGLIVLSLLAACGGKTPSAAESTDSSNPYAKNMEISVSLWNVQDGFDDPNAANDTIYEELAQKFNVTLKPVQVTWNDWMEKFRLWAASNQLPDAFATDASLGEYKTWATQGVIRALPDDLSKYPNIQAVMSLPSVKPLAINGKFYKFPRMTYKTDADWINDRNILYRKDWAKEAGWDRQPESFEEFVQMCKAVLANHPEAVGIGQHHNGYLLIIHLGIFPQGSHGGVWAKDADGLWKPCYACDGFAEGVAQLRTLYTEGILDPDFALLKDSDASAKFMSGQAFAVFAGHVYWDYEDAFKRANPGKSAEEVIGLIDMWPNPHDGKRYYFSEAPYWSESMFRGDMNDEKMDRVLAMLEYMYTDEYKIKVAMGIEGVDYKKENGAYISLLPPDQLLSKKYPITNKIGSLSAWGQWLGLEGVQIQSSNPNIAYTDKYWQEHYRYTKEIAIPTPVNYDIRLMSTPAKDKLASVTQDWMLDMVRVIMGKGDPIQEWKAVIKSYSPGLDDAIREVNEQAKVLGIN
ncbi:MAG: extracellular solute-binding protein [Treponema sp.]|jgi:putative aldouronate transport system substrate-binding protein|nr:extracellular solute-binding protein [Treponema sp.]